MGLFEVTDEELYQDEIRRPLAEKIEIALARIREYEPMALELSSDGYYVAFSGGKDSIVMERLFKMAGVKYQSYYNNVTIDPPELIYFIREFYPEVKWNNPKKHLIRMMVEKGKGPPNRFVRWCCEIYKEQGGNGTFKSIGVRAEESPRRKAAWSFLSSDRRKGLPILCPLIHWTDSDIWQFIHENQMDYCSLYDEGFKRLGCIGCPMGGPKGQKKDFQKWPQYEEMWRRGVVECWEKWEDIPTMKGKPRTLKNFKSGEDLWEWWISGKAYEGKKKDCQGYLW